MLGGARVAATSVLERPDGSVVVVDLGEPAVKLLSRTGQVVRTIGRKGAGPGEYQQPTVVLAGRNGQMFVVDRALRRLLVLDSTLRATGVAAFPPGLTEAAQLVRGTDRQGRIFMQTSWLGPDPRNPSAGVHVVRWDPRSTQVDTIAALRPPVAKTSRSGNDDQADVSRYVMPFAAQDEWGVGADGAVAIAHVADFHVEWYGNGPRPSNGPRIPFSPLR